MSTKNTNDDIATEGCAPAAGYVGELPPIPDEFKGWTAYCLDCMPSNRELEIKWRWCPKCQASWKRRTPHTKEAHQPSRSEA